MEIEKGNRAVCPVSERRLRCGYIATGSGWSEIDRTLLAPGFASRTSEVKRSEVWWREQVDYHGLNWVSGLTVLVKCLIFKV